MTGDDVTFGINHIAAPRLRVRDFFGMARNPAADVEIRNDLPGNATLDGTPASEVLETARQAGVRILAFNGLQKFNVWSAERAREAAGLVAYARDCGAEALVLAPANDVRGEIDPRDVDLSTAISALAPMLSNAGLVGLIEPLGFATSTLHSKRVAADAIMAGEHSCSFRLVHDTFHHAVAGEADLFPALTGLVHISGVVCDQPAPDWRGGDRVLIDDRDRVGNIEQIRALIDAGYAGPFSFEPFSDDVHNVSEPKSVIAASMKYVEAALSKHTK